MTKPTPRVSAAQARVRWVVAGEAASDSWWSLQARHVFASGRLFTPAPRPDGISLGSPKLCYVNAADAALDSEYSYCEGWACSGEHVVPHAWLTRHGHDAIEVTWPHLGDAYLGVALSPEQLHGAG